jgi:hypothetical protein
MVDWGEPLNLAWATWYKSWRTCKSRCTLGLTVKALTINDYWFQGQALAKINIGDVLDCDGDWMGALNAFEEGYR